MTRPPRLLHLISGLEIGGAETMVLRLGLGLRDRGWEVTVVSLIEPGPVGRDLLDAGLPVMSLKMRRGRPSPFGLARLHRVLRKFRPDVLQTWLYHADLLGLLAGKAAGVPRIAWNVRASNMDMSRYRTFSRWTRAACARLSRLPDVVVVNSEAGRAYHEGLGYRPRRWEVIPNGFELATFQPDPGARAALRGELGIAPDDVLVGLVARFDPMKDQENFLRACALAGRRHRELRFLMVGEGATPSNELLAGWIDQAGLRGRVACLGPRSDLPRVYAALDVAALSSRTEGFPNAVGEAMACGIATAVTDVGDARALVADTGLVVPPSDPTALAEAFDRLIREGAEGRKRRGMLGRRRIEENYALANIVQRYADLYSGIAGKRSCAA
jgi:glycosyltransferase involved in cell wall biosynthesis